jgi:hypothetical protein
LSWLPPKKAEAAGLSIGSLPSSTSRHFRRIKPSIGEQSESNQGAKKELKGEQNRERSLVVVVV